MSWISIDVESDGPCDGNHSMVSFGAVIVEEGLSRTFYGQLKPTTDNYDKETLAISNISREEHEQFDDPIEVMKAFELWIKENNKGRPIFVSDNNGFDFGYINFYFHKFLGNNPFGWSSRRVGDLFCGFYKDTFYSWKKHRAPYKHTHHPVDDAKGNAQAILYLKSQGLKINLK